MENTEDIKPKKFIVDLIPGDKFSIGGLLVSVISVDRIRGRGLYRVVTLRPIVSDFDEDEDLVIEMWLHKNLEIELEMQ